MFLTGVSPTVAVLLYLLTGSLVAHHERLSLVDKQTLSNSMEQSSSWEANSHVATQGEEL